MIVSNDYYATNLDIWILAKKYNIPLIFISGTKLAENDRTFLVAHNDNSDKYYFIKSPGIRTSNLPKYRLYIHENQMKIPVTSFSSDIQTDIRLHESELSINQFIELFSSKKLRKPKKAKQKLKLILEEEELKKPKKKKEKLKLVLEDELLAE
jgi:predicted GIY-YIG superfamily endonuclease